MLTMGIWTKDLWAQKTWVLPEYEKIGGLWADKLIQMITHAILQIHNWWRPCKRWALHVWPDVLVGSHQCGVVHACCCFHATNWQTWGSDIIMSNTRGQMTKETHQGRRHPSFGWVLLGFQKANCMVHSSPKEKEEVRLQLQKRPWATIFGEG